METHTNDYKLYSVKDNLAEEYGPIFTAKTDAVAKRNYANMIISNKVNSNEYQLVYLGEYNSQTGKIKSVDKVKIINTEEYMVSLVQNKINKTKENIK